jgi:hypothetical protein
LRPEGLKQKLEVRRAQVFYRKLEDMGQFVKKEVKNGLKKKKF